MISNALQDLQVERVYLKPDDMVNALLSDQVDAISIWEPYGYRASQLTSLPIINLGTEGIFQLTFNLVTTSPVDALNARDKAMLLAIEEAITWIEEHPVDSIALISEQLNIKPEQVEWSWNDYIFQSDERLHLAVKLANASEVGVGARYLARRARRCACYGQE
ncbi:hypothetical protein QW180_18010 [Vibrio sinaloensis]|nr:hypothetical protein [Vibrio sinaloensis]